MFKKTIGLSVIALALVTAGCSSSSNSDVADISNDDIVTGTDTGTDLTEIEPTGIISSVAVSGIEGTFYAGQPPEQVGSVIISPIAAEDDVPVEFISGGSTRIPVQANAVFSTVFVVTSEDDGYFVINLNEEVLEADLIVSYSTLQIDGLEDQISVQVQTSTGEVSGQESLDVSSVQVGTGDLQVSVSWDTETDVDLYLIEPDGTEIYFAHDVSESQGALDLDSNVACVIDGVNNENIAYENVEPPVGEYTVIVDYYSSCGIETNTSYVVTVRIDGQVRTYSGHFTPDESGDSHEITTFEITQ